MIDDQLQEMIEQDRQQAIVDAHRLLMTEPLILDTETTGVDHHAEIVELAVVPAGAPAASMSTLVRPSYGISADATAIHGITELDVAEAPSIGVALDSIHYLLMTDSSLAIYNRDFDLRLIRQSAAAIGRYDWVEAAMALRSRTTCVMELYAHFYGEWHEYHQSYTWQSLGRAAVQCGLEWEGPPHRALADAHMTHSVLKHMAAHLVQLGDDGA